jgi:anti-sigma-K factor RskA
MDHDAIKELLPLAALDRLAPDEAAILEEHLRAGCDECAAELRAYREAAADIAFANEPSASNDRVWDRLASRLAEAQPAGLEAATPLPRVAGKRPSVPSERRASGWSFAAGFAIAATVLLATYAGLLASRLRQNQLASRSRIASLEQTVDRLRADLMDARTRMVVLEGRLQNRERLQRVLLTPDVSLTRLAPLAAAPDASAIIAVSPSRRSAVITARGLPPAPPGKTYELWWITKESGPVPAGLFTARDTAGVSASVSPPPAGQHVLLSAVTLEPSPGVPKPTGTMYLKGTPS